MRALLPVSAAILVLANIVVTLLFAPEAARFAAPISQRLFYWHVPSAWAAYLAFGVTAIASIMHTLRPSRASDATALASVEVGAVFSVIALVTGVLWSRMEWINHSLFEDPKLITLIVLVFAYFGYLALRASIDERERRARLAAVYGILAFLSVPLSYFASRASIHPDFIREGSGLDPTLRAYLLFSTFTFTVLYAALARVRYDLARIEDRIADQEESA